MTAVVGILNKKAVAIAADSAVTLGSGKIFNKANKIFALSENNPVGIMIHNNADFMGTPWETIIKIYRHKLGINTFNTLEDYQKDFISFLYKNNFFSDEKQQMDSLMSFCDGIIYHLIGKADKEVAKGSNDRNVLVQEELKIKIQEHIILHGNNKDILNDFKGYSYEEFDNYIDTEIQNNFQEITKQFGLLVDEPTKKLFKKSFYNELIVKEFYTNSYTGLVFTGFGENDIFPSLVHVHIYLGFNNKLRYFINTFKNSKITHSSPSDVCTFAQSDVIFTILTGVAPDLKEVYNQTFKDFVTEYDNVLLSNYNNDKGDLMFLLNNTDKDALTKVFTEIMDGVIHNKYISPLYEAVAGLSKEDLAEMAESLIYSTYLQRRITNAQESVGGPVDVAILSKGDGFIWIKRKQYFNSDLNPHFIKNYF